MSPWYLSCERVDTHETYQIPESCAPRRVNPLAQSEISSRTKRSKGTENTPVPLSRLRICGGDGGREDAGVDIAGREGGRKTKGGEEGGESRRQGRLAKQQERTHVRRVQWPPPTPKQSHSIPRAQTRKFCLAKLTHWLPARGSATWSDWRASGRLTHGRRNRPERALSSAAKFPSHPHHHQPCFARQSQGPLSMPPPARAGSLLGPSSLARTMRKSFPITSSPETYVSSGLDSLFCLSDNSCAHPLQQVGSLPKNDVDVGTGLVGAPAYVSCSPFVSLSASSADPYVPSVGAAMS